jgi:hypothetical protein
MNGSLLNDVLVGPKIAGYPIARQREPECGSFTLTTLGPNPASVALNDAMHDGQAHSIALRLLGMKTLKDLKESCLTGFGYSKSVVSHPIIDCPILDSPADLQLEGPVRTPVLETVADQVRENLAQ